MTIANQKWKINNRKIKIEHYVINTKTLLSFVVHFLTREFKYEIGLYVFGFPLKFISIQQQMIQSSEAQTVPMSIPISCCKISIENPIKIYMNYY